MDLCPFRVRDAVPSMNASSPIRSPDHDCCHRRHWPIGPPCHRPPAWLGRCVRRHRRRGTHPIEGCRTWPRGASSSARPTTRGPTADRRLRRRGTRAADLLERDWRAHSATSRRHRRGQGRSREPGFVYTSVLHADRSPLGLAGEHRETEALIKAAGLTHVLLRNGWYVENYLAALPMALKHGAFLGSAGEGRISWATRADYADAAAAVLTRPIDGHAAFDRRATAGTRCRNWPRRLPARAASPCSTRTCLARTTSACCWMACRRRWPSLPR